MIGFISGVLVGKSAPLLLVETAGIGYEVQASLTTFADLPAVGERVKLLTHFVVREDAQQLFGFSREEERRLFRTIIKVSGVGPKLALAILSGMDAKGFSRCILESDIKSLTKLPGVGKKTAERLVIEVKDKLPPMESGEGAGGVSVGEHDTGIKATLVGEAETALIALGYKPVEASKALARLDTSSYETAEQLIRAALQAMINRKT